MKIMFITGSRGEWGYIRPILNLINARNDVEYVLVVTNMHLLPSYGNSYKEIENDGFKIHYKVNMSLDGYNHYTHAKSLGLFLSSLPDIVENEKPDWIVLAGDRGEQLIGAIVGGFTYTPVAHIQAGELSGNIDGMTRHAIGKYAHLHFAANEDAKLRLLRLGEEPFRVYNVGAPQVDELVNAKYSNLDEIENKLGLVLKYGYILTVMHPVTEEYIYASKQAEIVIRALNNINLPKIVIMPNNDAGSQNISDAINSYKQGNYYTFANLKREDYLGLLKNCNCIVGNSSSGLLEAPTFRTPAVNVGRRQNMRVRGINVIDVNFDEHEIVKAINIAISKDFKDLLETNCENPYGNGDSSKKILDILTSTPKDEDLLIKKLTY